MSRGFLRHFFADPLLVACRKWRSVCPGKAASSKWERCRPQALADVSRMRIRDLDGLFDDRAKSFPPAKLEWCRVHRDAPAGVSFFVPPSHWPAAADKDAPGNATLEPQEPGLDTWSERWKLELICFFFSPKQLSFKTL